MISDASTRWLQGIALFKVGKSLGLLAVFATSLELIRYDPILVVTRWALACHVDPDNHYLHTVLAWLLGIDRKHLEIFAIGTGLYALLFAVEGVGLWLAKRWAEYLTIFSTAGFLPVEGYEVLHHPNITKYVILTLNVVIVMYLVKQVQKRTAT